MGKRFLHASLLLLVLLFSCQQKQHKENEQADYDVSENKLAGEENDLYKEVMAIHDEVMITMSDIMALNKALKEKATTLDNAKEKKAIQQLSADLEAANESMMNWMRKFNPNLENMSHEEIMNYLKAEKQKIEEVKKNMQLAQERAEQYF